MKFTLENNEQLSIDSYQPGTIIVARRSYQSNIIINPNTVLPDWPATDIKSLSFDDLEIAIFDGLEVLILGTGQKQIFPPMQIAARLSQDGIGFEVMDTAAACRTYNILLSEGRNISAVLINR